MTVEVGSKIMSLLDWIILSIGGILIVLFSILAALADRRRWRKTRRRKSALDLQRQITMGKSHLR
jgi:hypothetical protein